MFCNPGVRMVWLTALSGVHSCRLLHEITITSRRQTRRRVCLLPSLKKYGKAVEVFTKIQSEHERTVFELENAMRSGLVKREFRLHYQPQYDCHGRICAVEALLRWQHPSRGLLPATMFIPIAETTGLVVPLGR
jgi:predicted signal transduction protein with EAL and GGDEF domain